MTGTEVFYSYETCGNINSYSDDDLFKVHAGNVVAGAVLAWPPWVVHEQGIDEKQSEFRGASALKEIPQSNAKHWCFCYFLLCFKRVS